MHPYFLEPDLFGKLNEFSDFGPLYQCWEVHPSAAGHIRAIKGSDGVSPDGLRPVRVGRGQRGQREDTSARARVAIQDRQGAQRR
jgi:hypothetical protein